MSYEYLPLSETHQWRAKPNHRILVLDRGALRFDYPDDWPVAFENDGAIIHDQEPPDDKCRLVASCRRIAVGSSTYPLLRILETLIANDARGVTANDPMVRIHRPPLEVAWAELRFNEPTIGRLACSRVCVARAGCTQAYLTFDFWPEDSERCDPVWENILQSLEVGSYIDDPATGQRREIRG